MKNVKGFLASIYTIIIVSISIIFGLVKDE